MKGNFAENGYENILTSGEFVMPFFLSTDSLTVCVVRKEIEMSEIIEEFILILDAAYLKHGG